MTARQKILLITVIPTILSLLSVAFFVEFQTRRLFEQQSSVFHQGLLDIRKAELVNYTQLARTSIDHIVNDQSLSDIEKYAQAKSVMTNLAYASDGYFYAYTSDGVNLVHPKQPYRIGKAWWELRDSEGKLIIQDLIAQAQAGGGFTEYFWEQPSSGEVGKKLGYSEMLGDWDWMFGTGIYIDDLDKQVGNINTVFDAQIRATSYMIIAIAAVAVASVFAFGQFFQLTERKQTDGKLQALNKRVINTQDEERRRVSRELHDGISQRLVVAKYSLEEAYESINKNLENTRTLIKTSESHIDDTLTEIRRISHDLHPSILDDLGLMTAVQALLDPFSKRTGINVTFKKSPFRNLLPTAAKTALYRIVQEALTNIEKHANATSATVMFETRNEWYRLTISDNGDGFSTEVTEPADTGLGLRSMSERIGYYNGVFTIESTSEGTTLVAGIPRSNLNIANQHSGMHV
ncbi:MAG: cache domain-containing protein [Granulosicoccus sp.]